MSHELRYNLENRRFGRLLALWHATPRPGDRGAMWMCRCSCGALVPIRGRNLRAGKTRSCGCLRTELSARRLRALNAGKLTNHSQPAGCAGTT